MPSRAGASPLDRALARVGAPLLCGHRGAAATHPENTLESFEAALDAGCDAVELDVHVCADGGLAVIHDRTVDRTTDGTGAVAAMTKPELARLDTGSWRAPAFAGAHVPMLGEVLELCRDRCLVLVELKASIDANPDAALRVAAVVRALRMRDAALLLAFDHRHLRAARDGAPWLARVPLCEVAPDDPVSLLESLDAAALAPRWPAVDAAVCEAVHGSGRRVVTWTVDDPLDAARLAREGADVVITNDPARVGPALKAR
jgi:glycerophosphoryl diester phosphodiesterase